jgi:hypothetical protein
MRARRGGLARARFWRAQGFPNLKLAVEARKRKAAERRALGLISPEWAKRLRRKGIAVGNAIPVPPESAPGAANDRPALESSPIRPMVVVDGDARGLTLSQFRAR